MEDPVAEIPHVIHLLTQTPPSIQQRALAYYFTRNASFTHPFCRTGSFDVRARVANSPLGRALERRLGWKLDAEEDDAIGVQGKASWSERWCLELLTSRGFILGIYRWYKILSPKILLGVDSVAFDERNLKLYVSLHQTFDIPFIPFFRITSDLVTVLALEAHSANNPEALSQAASPPVPNGTSAPARRYYIASQNDRYQVDEFTRFLDPLSLLLRLVLLVQFFATAVCVVGQAVFAPVAWVEDGRDLRFEAEVAVGRRVDEVRREVRETVEGVKREVGEKVEVVKREVQSHLKLK